VCSPQKHLHLISPSSSNSKRKRPSAVAISLLDSGLCWIAGDDGSIFKTNTGNSMSRKNTKVSKSGELCVSVCGRRLQYAVNKASHVNFIIYSLDGKYITRIDKKTPGSGKYVVDLASLRLSAGAYVFTYKNGDEVRKTLSFILQ
jgi:hypothetical protein